MKPERTSPESRGNPSPVAGERADTSAARVLIVEDEPLVALDLKARLQAMGHEVVGVAATGEEALQQAKAAAPSLLLVDVHLAGDLDGVQVVERLDADTGPSVIFVTGNGDPRTLGRISAVHPYSTILKPIRDRELQISIEAALHHHRLRQELQQERDSLERRVRERTAELAASVSSLNRQIAAHLKLESVLRQSRSETEAAIRSRTRFFGNISREIRTPMNGVIGMAELLDQTPLTPEQEDFLRTLRISANQLLATIDDVITFASLEGGSLPRETGRIDLRERLRTVLESLAGESVHRQVELTSDVAPGVPEFVFAEVGRIERVLARLVGFCFRSPATHSVSIETELLSTVSGRAHIHFKINDDSDGVEPEALARIQQLLESPEAHARSLEDLCYGLAVPSLLATSMEGGMLWLESVPRVGNTFHWSLWLATTMPQKATVAEQDISLGSAFLGKEEP